VDELRVHSNGNAPRECCDTDNVWINDVPERYRCWAQEELAVLALF